jgi:hypothetical protein
MMSAMGLPSSKFAKVVTLGIQTYNDKYVPHIGCIILHPPPLSNSWMSLKMMEQAHCLILEVVEAKAKKHISLPLDPLPKPQLKLAQGLFRLLPYMLENMNCKMG